VICEKYAQAIVAPRPAWWHVLDMDNLARIREARGLTQSQLAEAIGANQATISKIEKGRGNPTLDMIQRIAAALKIHPSELFSRGALEQRVLDALGQLRDDQAREAALTVLEAMASGKSGR
jgi:transcriptional regulator with XRE-family HTH domain